MTLTDKARELFAELYRLFEKEAEYRDMVLWTPCNPRKEVKGLTHSDISQIFEPARVFSDIRAALLAALQREQDEAAERAKLLTYEMERCRGICINYKLEGGNPALLLESVNRSLDRALDLYRAAILSQPKGETRKEGGGMNEWQRCPVCDGHGLVAYPPGVAYEMRFSTSSAGPWPCQRCNGAGTILRPAPDERNKEGKA